MTTTGLVGGPTRWRHSRPGPRAVAIVALVSIMAIMVVASPAGADPAGPTDYQTVIVAIEPPTAAVTVEAIAGDSFVRITVEPGHEVQVVGYRGEPYLRVESDGVVKQNDNSPSRWLNDDRYGEAEPPPVATAEADPDWVVVATDGTWSWHDHRAHWMHRVKPPGAEPGDTVLEAVIPLSVDGRTVSVSVRSVLLASPSPWAGVPGALLAIILLVVAHRWGLGGVNLAATTWSLLAVGLGLVAYRSVPPETGPSPLLWLLPSIGLGAGFLAAGRAGSIAAGAAGDNTAGPIRSVLVILVGAELVLWAWPLRAALTRAYLPTNAPFWLDRAVIAGSLAMGAGTVVIAVATVVSRPETVSPSISDA